MAIEADKELNDLNEDAYRRRQKDSKDDNDTEYNESTIS